MREVKVYESDDGKRFETAGECANYELRNGVFITFFNGVAYKKEKVSSREEAKTFIKNSIETFMKSPEVTYRDMVHCYNNGYFSSEIFSDFIDVTSVTELKIDVDTDSIDEVFKCFIDGNYD